MAKIRIPKTEADFNIAMTAWAAGIVDGEGSVELVGRAYKGKAGHFKMPKIAVGMTHEETIMKLGNYFGCGAIWERPPIKEHYLPCWYWVVTTRHARFVATMIRPHAVTKAESLDRLLNHPFQEKFGPGKISEQQVREMRKAYFLDKIKQKDLIKQFNVSRGTVWGIMMRATWAKTDLDLPTLIDPPIGRVPD